MVTCPCALFCQHFAFHTAIYRCRHHHLLYYHITINSFLLIYQIYSKPLSFSLSQTHSHNCSTLRQGYLNKNIKQMKIKHTLSTYFLFKEILCGWTRHPYVNQVVMILEKWKKLDKWGRIMMWWWWYACLNCNTAQFFILVVPYLHLVWYIVLMMIWYEDKI